MKCEEILLKDLKTGGIVYRLDVRDKTNKEIDNLGLDMIMRIDNKEHYIERSPNNMK